MGTTGMSDEDLVRSVGASVLWLAYATGLSFRTDPSFPANFEERYATLGPQQACLCNAEGMCEGDPSLTYHPMPTEPASISDFQRGDTVMRKGLDELQNATRAAQRCIGHAVATGTIIPARRHASSPGR